MTNNGAPQKKWNEETISMILGLLMVVVVSFVVIRLVDRNKGNIDIPGITLERGLSPVLELNGENQVTPSPIAAVVSPTASPTIKPTATPTVKPKATATIRPTNTPAKVSSPTPTSSRRLITPTPSKNGSPEGRLGNYVVKRGDSLWKIAQGQLNNGYRWTEIARLNNLKNPGLIWSGMSLKLPETKKAAGMVVKENNLPVMGKDYQVARGDSLWKIALGAYGDGYQWPLIWQANKQKVRQPGLLEVGMKLTIPKLENEGDGKGVLK